jgi:DNA-binding NarL/FixJ family response regulator
MISDYAEQELDLLVPAYPVIALLFAATALSRRMGALQAPLCIALSALEASAVHNCFLGMAFALVAAIILLRNGAFRQRPFIKAAALALLGSASFTLPVVVSSRPPISHASTTIAILIYSAIVFTMAQGRILAEPGLRKPVLRLESYSLTKRETEVIRARLGGKNVKEIAFEFGLSPSTIRNAQASASHKLGLTSREELGAMGERFRVE